MKHLMIDLETLGTTADSVFLSLAATQFDLDGKIGLTFSQNIKLESALDAGRKINSSTLEWWLSQNPTTMRKMFFSPQPIRSVLANFMNFFSKKVSYVWSNGASFDIPMLNHAFVKEFGRAPWKYSNERCYRTVFALSGIPHVPMELTKHDPLDDCYYQIAELVRALKHLNINEHTFN